MSEWKEYKLGEVAEIIGGGTPDTSNRDYWGGKIPWISLKDLTGYNKIYIEKGERNITELGYKNSSTRLLPKGTVLFSSRAPIGYVAIASNPICTNQGFKSLVCNETIVNNVYLYYWLKSNTEYLQSLGTGTTFAEISGSALKTVNISLPPIEEQKQIAGVLSSLDDKIDLLNRENATLEALAETLFCHYFIENPNPEWKEMPVSYYGKVICGKTPSKKNEEYYGGEVPFIKIPDMHGNTYVFNSEDTLSEKGKESQKEKTLPKGSIMVSCIATVGLVSMNAIEAQTNQQINSVVPNDEQYRFYLYCWFKSMYDELNTMASGGTATLNLNTGDFSRIGITLPDDDAIKEFHLQVKPIFAKIRSNQQQMQTLAAQRDTLLPRLMSGEVKVGGQ